MGMTNNDDLALKLKAAAEKATPGEWHKGRQDHVTGIIKVYAQTGSIKLSCIAKTDAHEVGFGISEREHRGNAELISLTSPFNILALLAERDAKDARIADLEQQVILLQQKHEIDPRTHKIIDLEERIAELEARTVSVKLLDCDFSAVQHMSGGNCYYCNGFVDGTQNAIKCVKASSAEAGINLEVRE